MPTPWRTGRRLLILATCWLIGLPALTLTTLMVAAGASGGLVGASANTFYIFSGTAIALWLLPPLALLGVWLWSRRQAQPPKAPQR
jgi:hypothetical protein